MRRQTVRRIALYISVALFPVTFYYLSPVLILQGASEGIVNGSFLVFSAMLISSLFLGRLWCGWVCPGSALGEICSRARGKRVRIGRWDLLKFLVWIPWIALIAIIAVGAGGYSRVDPFYETVYGISILAPGAIFVLFGVLLLISGSDLLIGRRAFCHYLCWMAPFMVIGGWFGSRARTHLVKLKADPDRCIHCGACTRNCPMSLDVEGMVARGDMRNSECILCMSCVDACPVKAIR